MPGFIAVLIHGFFCISLAFRCGLELRSESVLFKISVAGRWRNVLLWWMEDLQMAKVVLKFVKHFENIKIASFYDTVKGIVIK